MSQTAAYRPRHPQSTTCYQCFEDYWDEFKQSYPYFYEAEYGPLRPVLEKTVARFLECGVLRHGFARLKCEGCAHETLLAFSCKCPSCQAKRVAAFVEWVTEEVLEAVDHRQYVWTIPRVLRPAFRKDRRLLGRLSRCAWISLRQYAQAALGDGFVPGVVVAIQTYGDELNCHEHIHLLASDSAWRPDGGCDSMGEVDCEVLTRLFQHQVLEAMVAERRLSRDFAQKLRAWHPSGFGVRRTLDALDWIALVTSPIPDPGEQMTRYYHYSNASRGKRRQVSSRATVDGACPASDSEEPSAAEQFSQQRRRSWARLLRKVYEVDPLECPKCGSTLHIIAAIEQRSVIEQILQHLDLWQEPQRAPPPRLFPHKLESFLASLSPQQAQAVRASSDALFWDEVPIWED